MVFLSRCESEDTISDAAFRAPAGLSPPLELDGKRVFLKVNLMKGAPPSKALNTHPEVVRGVIRWVRSQGGDPVFGDSCGIPGFTDQAAKAASYDTLSQDEEARFVNLDAGEFLPMEIAASSIGTVWISRDLLEADVRITLPKLKTHTLMGFTGAVKNQVGILPGSMKARLHVRAPSPRTLAQAVIEINERVPFHAGVMDATFALEGGGSRKGSARWVGCVMASRDLLALDLAACEVMGSNPAAMPLFRHTAPGRSVVTQKVTWTGDARLRVTPPFREAHWDAKRIPPVSRLVYTLRERAFSPRHDPKRCRDCGDCEKYCPTEAVRRIPGRWIQMSKCIRCFACTSRCPELALFPDGLWYLKPFMRSRMQGVESPCG